VRQKYLKVISARIAISANTMNATPKITRHGVRSAVCSDGFAAGAGVAAAGVITCAGGAG